MNNITIAGQLGKDAELRSIPSGEQVLSFSVADSQGRDKPTIWWSCALWGKRASSLQQYLVKGQAVTVTGTLTERAYTDKNGQERKAQDIRVNDIALQGGRREGTTPVKTPDGQVAHVKPAAKPYSGFDDMPDDVPF